MLDLGAIMHDLGLTFEVSGTQRFKFCGEDTARHFLLKHGASTHRIALAWDSLAFHTSEKINDQMRAGVALVGFGVHAGPPGIGIESQPIKHVRKVFQTWPRHGVRHAFPQLEAEIVGRKSETVPEGDWNTARLPEDSGVSDGQWKGGCRCRRVVTIPSFKPRLLRVSDGVSLVSRPSGAGR